MRCQYTLQGGEGRKSEDDHVKHDKKRDLIREMSNFDETAKDFQRNRFDSVWRRVFVLPRLPEAREAKINFAKDVQTGIQGPHCGHLLRHCTDGIFNRARSDGLTTGCDSPTVVSDREDLKERDSIETVSIFL